MCAAMAQEVAENSPLLRIATEEGKLTIVQAYHSLDTGAVTRLR